MTLLEWKDEYSVGIESVDLEHRELIGLINDVNELIRKESASSRVIEGLGEIFAQISAHFALEEKIMRDTAYDEYGSHKADHERLLDEIRDIMDRVEDGGVYDETIFGQELNDWFGVHFRTHDARFHRHVDAESIHDSSA